MLVLIQHHQGEIEWFSNVLKTNRNKVHKDLKLMSDNELFIDAADLPKDFFVNFSAYKVEDDRVVRKG